MSRPDWPHNDETPKSWTTSPGAQQTEREVFDPHRHEFRCSNTPTGHFDELLWLRAERARLDALMVDVLAVLEEMNSALNQHATGGRHPQAKEYHRAVMRVVKEEVKRSH